ncbi:MAG: ABC-2 family transporter protein [Ignavibacteriales bacterium]
MNLRGGIALVRKSLMVYTASRTFIWVLSVGWMMGPLVYLFVWVVAAGQGTVGGFGRSEFVFYYVCVILVNQLTYPSSHWVVGEGIRAGTMSVWLLRPLPPAYEAIASDIAVKVVCMPFVLAISVLLAAALRFRSIIPVRAIPAFFAALLLAQVLRFMFSYVLSLLAFWTQRIDSVLALTDACVFLLGGLVALAVMDGELWRGTSTPRF